MSSPDNTRHLWVVEGNFKTAQEVEGVPPRPYPLAFLCPTSSLSTEGEAITLEPSARTISCSCELAMVVDRRTHRLSESQAANCIRGYRVMVGLRDSSHLDRLARPTDRDRGVCAYYARWSNGFNCLSRTLIPSSAVDGLYERAIRLEVEGVGQVETSTAAVVLRAPAVLAFLSQFVSLQAGDVIALGPTAPQLVVPASRPLPPGTLIRGEIQGLATLVTPLVDQRQSTRGDQGCKRGAS